MLEKVESAKVKNFDFYGATFVKDQRLVAELSFRLDGFSGDCTARCKFNFSLQSKL